MLNNCLRYAWRYFWDAWRFVERAGRWEADPIHLELIDAVLLHLEASNAKIIREQLAERYFFSWMSEGRINVFFFYDEKALGLIQDEAFEDRLFKVELFVDGRRYVAQVGFYQGRIHRVELKKPRSFFKGKSYGLGAVTEGNPSKSYTAVIDHAEHGRETEINP